MSAVVTDTKNLSDQETPIYVMIAVLLSVLVLSVTMDSFLAPFRSPNRHHPPARSFSLVPTHLCFACPPP